MAWYRRNGKQGTELADLIVNKIKQAVNTVCPVLIYSRSPAASSYPSDCVSGGSSL
jgi:hypothetical protein